MADLAPVPGLVVATPGDSSFMGPYVGVLGEDAIQGDAVYLDDADNTYKLASTWTAAKAKCQGFVLSAGSKGQRVAIIPGINYGTNIADLSSSINFGCAIQEGETYVLSDTPGKVKPIGDLLGGDYVTYLGIGADSQNVRLNINATGEQWTPSPNPNVAYTTLFPAPPDPYLRDGRGASIVTWIENRYVPQILANIPRERSTTYYFSQAGDDALGVGSEENPWKSIVQANAVIAAGSGDMRLRFKRGEVWREHQNLLIDVGKDGITIDDYGDENLAKPIFTNFGAYQLLPPEAGSYWTNVAGNTWRYDFPAMTPVWVRRRSEEAEYSTGLFDPLKEEDSLVNCEAYEKSFYYDTSGHKLYVNTGGPDPNTTQYEYVNNNAASGWQINADNVRIQNIVLHGGGMTHSVGYGMQILHANTSGVHEVVVMDSEIFYTGYHALGQIAGQTNRAVFLRVKAGYCMDNSSDCTTFVSYGGNGGFEFVMMDCTVVAGGLPSYTWSAAVGKHLGSGVYQHTNDSSHWPILSCGLRTQYANEEWQAAVGTQLVATPSASDLATEVRCWIIGEDYTGNISPTLGYGFKDRMWINCRYIWNTSTTDYGGKMTNSLSHSLQAWCLNCVLEINFFGSSTFGANLYLDGDAASPVDTIFENCRFRFTGINLHGWFGFGHDYGSRCKLRNCEFSAEGGTATYALTDAASISAGIYSHCAYASPVTIGSPYAPITDVAPVTYANGSSIPAGSPVSVVDMRYGAGVDNNLEYDIDGAARSDSRFDIGAHVGTPP